MRPQTLPEIDQWIAFLSVRVERSIDPNASVIERRLVLRVANSIGAPEVIRTGDNLTEVHRQVIARRKASKL